MAPDWPVAATMAGRYRVAHEQATRSLQPVVRAGDFVFVSGQLGMADGSLVDGGVSGQTTQAVANLAAPGRGGATLTRW